jgi:succinoglycan biosynthesis transport protein ExoP
MANDVRSREASPAEASLDGELDFGAVGRALWRKRFWVLVPAALVAVLAFAAVNIITPRYKSESRIFIEGRESVFLRPDAERNGDRDRGVLDQEAITSQVQLALSRDVARQVIKQLKLHERPEFDPVLRGVGAVKQVLILLGVARDPLRMSPEERIFETYYERVTAYQVDKSRVIAIEFQSADPEFAARGANAVADAYLAQMQVVRQEQTRAAGQWLAGEIEGLRARVADAESKVEEFRSRSNLFVGANNGSLSNQQLGEVTSQVAAARSQKAEADAKAQSIREMLRAGRPIEAGEIINSEFIRRLNEQRVTLRAQLAEQSSTLLGGHPRIKELRAQIADLERQIRAEVERIVRSLESDASIAGARVEQLTKNLELLKRQASSTNEDDVKLRALEREAKSQRDLLESYLAKYREATARDTMGASGADARVISRAIVSNTPYFPKKLPIVLIATLATLLLGVGFIATGELLAGNVYRPGMAGAPDLPADGTERPEFAPSMRAAMPQMATAPTAPPFEHSLAAAAQRLRAEPEARSRVAVVGLAPDIATDSAALALARALSVEQRVVMIDLAMAAPEQASTAADRSARGIADVVRGKASFGEIIARDHGSRVHLIAAGDAGEDPAALLSSERLAIALDAFARTYEHVILNLGAMPEIAEDRLMRLAPCIVLVTPAGMMAVADAARETLLAAGCRDVVVMASEAATGDAPRDLAVAA